LILDGIFEKTRDKDCEGKKKMMKRVKPRDGWMEEGKKQKLRRERNLAETGSW
jgi:hypothetical protein